MTKYHVLYCLKPTFMSGSATRETVRRTHVEVKCIQAANPDDAFGKMQGEVWSPNGEARDHIIGLGLQHTSMSVGDVLYEEVEDKYLECAFIGWREF